MEVEPAGEGEGRGDLDLDVEGEAMPMSQLCWWMAHGSFLHYYAFIISLSDLFWVESCFVVASCHENRSWNFIAKTWQSRRRYAGRSSNQLARARHRWHMFRRRCFRASCHWTTHQVGWHAAPPPTGNQMVCLGRGGIVKSCEPCYASSCFGASLWPACRNHRATFPGAVGCRNRGALEKVFFLFFCLSSTWPAISMV